MFRRHGDVEFDIFVHTWSKNTTHDGDHEIDPLDIEKFRSAYKPVAMRIDGCREPERGIIRQSKEPSSVKWQASQFYSMMVASQLKRNHEIDNGFDYDICVRGRMDLVFAREPLSVLARFPIPEPNTLYTVHSYDDPNFGRRVGDLFFYGASPSFDRACEFYRHAGRYPDSKYPGCPPEVPFYHYLFRDSGLEELQLPAEPQIRRPKDHPLKLGRHEIV
jgi:hypothetical protein